MGIAVVVVNYNTRALLRECLASVMRGGADRVVVVDNASTDGSGAMVREEYPGVVLRENTTNLGYGAAANQGVRLGGCEYALVLNSDTRLVEETVRVLHEYLDHHAEVAIAGPRLLNPDGSTQASCFPFPGMLDWLLDNEPIAPLARQFKRVRQRSLRFSPPECPRAVPWVLGAALAIRRSAFDRVGGFDESFFMYYEEVDLCWRLAATGWETHFVPSALVIHIGGGSTSQVRSQMLVQHFQSTLHFYRRHYGGPRRVAWELIMRTKIAYRLLRDVLTLWVIREDGRRDRLREDIAAWRRALSDAGARGQR